MNHHNEVNKREGKTTRREIQQTQKQEERNNLGLSSGIIFVQSIFIIKSGFVWPIDQILSWRSAQTTLECIHSIHVEYEHKWSFIWFVVLVLFFLEALLALLSALADSSSRVQ